MKTRAVFRFIYIGGLVSVLIAVFLSRGFFYANASSTEISPAITARQAYTVGLKAARDWNPGAQLRMLTSADIQSDLNTIYGENGTRKYWNMVFGIPESSQSLSISIVNGKIFREQRVVSMAPLIQMPDSQFDSPLAVRVAQQHYDLQPGRYFAVGYHFTINPSTTGHNAIMTVYGLDKNGYFSQVMFNMGNGKVVQAIHKLPYGGGLFETVHNRLVPVAYPKHSVYGIAVNPNDSADLICWGNTDPLSTRSEAFIARSMDGGKTWNNISSFSVTNAWYTPVSSTVYAEAGPDLYRLGSNSTWKLINRQHSIASASSYNNTIAILNGNGHLMISNNLGTEWNNITSPKDGSSIGYGPHGGLYLQTRSKLYKFSNAKWAPINVPSTEPIIGFGIRGVEMVISTQSHLYKKRIIQHNWKSYKMPTSVSRLFLPYHSTDIFLVTDRGILRIDKSGHISNITLPSHGQFTGIDVTIGRTLISMESQGIYEPFMPSSNH